MPVRCSISSCKNNKSSTRDVPEHVKYHRFPFRDEQLLRKWSTFMGQDYVPSRSHRICSRHFEPSCHYRYLNRIIALKKDAIPTIKHPVYLQVSPVLIDSIDIKHEPNLEIETKEDIEKLETSGAVFVDVRLDIKKEKEIDDDMAPNILEPEIDNKQGMDDEHETETEQDVATSSTVSTEFVDVQIAVKKEREIDSDIDPEFLEPLIDIKQQTDDDTDTETEQDVTAVSTIGAVFVNVEDAPLLAVDHHNGVYDPLFKVETCEEELGSSSRFLKTSDPLCEEGLARDSETMLSYVAKDDALTVDKENSVLPNSPSSEAKTSSSEEGFTCSKCEKTFKNRQNMITHLKTHLSRVKSYVCDVCSLAFTSRGYLTKHMQTHSRKWAYACGECGKRFRCSALLTAHTAVHSGQKAYACGECGKAFSGKYSLTKHVRTNHTAKKASRQRVEKVFVCEHCGKCSETESSLKQHMVTHTRGRCFRCDLCTKSFATKSYLKHHMRIHTGKKSIACDACGRGFITGSELKKHMLSHTGEKPFECSLCEMRFSFRHNLKTHLIRHSGLKPHICHVCDRRFADKHNMLRHAKMHVTKEGTVS